MLCQRCGIEFQGNKRYCDKCETSFLIGIAILILQLTCSIGLGSIVFWVLSNPYGYAGTADIGAYFKYQILIYLWVCFLIGIKTALETAFNTKNRPWVKAIIYLVPLPIILGLCLPMPGDVGPLYMFFALVHVYAWPLIFSYSIEITRGKAPLRFLALAIIVVIAGLYISSSLHYLYSFKGPSFDAEQTINLMTRLRAICFVTVFCINAIITNKFIANLSKTPNFASQESCGAEEAIVRDKSRRKKTIVYVALVGVIASISILCYFTRHKIYNAPHKIYNAGHEIYNASIVDYLAIRESGKGKIAINKGDTIWIYDSGKNVFDKLKFKPPVFTDKDAETHYAHYYNSNTEQVLSIYNRTVHAHDTTYVAELELHKSNGEEVYRKRTDLARYFFLNFSPDGNAFIIIDDNADQSYKEHAYSKRIMLIDVLKKKETLIKTIPVYTAANEKAGELFSEISGVWIDDMNFILLMHSDNGNRLKAIKYSRDGQVKNALIIELPFIEKAFASLDGKKLAVVQMGNITIFDLETGKLENTITRPMHHVTDIRFQPESQNMAVIESVPRFQENRLNSRTPDNPRINVKLFTTAGTELKTWNLHTEGLSPYDNIFSPDSVVWIDKRHLAFNVVAGHKNRMDQSNGITGDRPDVLILDIETNKTFLASSMLKDRSQK